MAKKKKIKTSKKKFFRQLGSKQKHRKDAGLLLKSTGKVVTNSADKEEVLDNVFASVFTGAAEAQVKGASSSNDMYANPAAVEKGPVRGLLQGLNPHKFMDLDGIHPTVLRQVVDSVPRSLSIISEKLWRSGDIPDDWKRAPKSLSSALF